ncbi:MAG: ribosome-associated translation inhibitor RaiA [Thermoanaerobaculaceae bacterium]|jgi:putative sigma-54 modulation protein|nr:ribosome-associated translation inhibitor RaiA [Thermoanaerobaculaceae bacterium]
MELEFIGRNVEITDEQRNLARKKMARLSKYFNSVHEARLTVAQEKHRVLVEAHVRGKDFEIAASAETSDWSTSLQEVVGKLEQQARRLKQKLIGRKRSTRSKEPAWQVAVVEATSLRAGTPQVVETRHVPVLPMTVDEASLQLEGTKEDFIVFREASSDTINVLYRRRDGTYGLVTPEF